MILPIIMAIWLGYRAKKVGRNVVVWAIAGAGMQLILTGIFNLPFLGSPRRRVDLGAYVFLRGLAALLSVLATIVVGIRLLPVVDRTGDLQATKADTAHVVGRTCMVCQAMIAVRVEGRVCQSCGSVFHHKCTSDDRCPKCA